jgi:hypothetical protein
MLLQAIIAHKWPSRLEPSSGLTKSSPKFFQTRTAGPKNINKESSEPKAGPESAPGASASSNPRPGESRTYIISVNGEEHKVTVTPAQ